MIELDCMGDMCPLPLMRLKKAVGESNGEEILLISDHSCTFRSITEYCKTKHYSFTYQEVMNGVWEILIRP